jgi:hypothetical protein
MNRDRFAALMRAVTEADLPADVRMLPLVLAALIAEYPGRRLTEGLLKEVLAGIKDCRRGAGAKV